VALLFKLPSLDGVCQYRACFFHAASFFNILQRRLDEVLTFSSEISLKNMDKEGAGYQTWEQQHERRKQFERVHNKVLRVMKIVSAH
jgi:hypothetical protein